MLIYLDSAQNRKGAPNENFAREVMELFTLGEGHYSEQDIKEAARAFTGWSLDRETGQFVFRPRHARRREQDGARPQRAASTATRCSTSCSRSRRPPSSSRASCGASSSRRIPTPREVKRIARSFRDSDYDIKVALRALLTSRCVLRAPTTAATLVKSPVELVVGTLRQLDLDAGADAAVRGRRGGHGAEPVLAAQRQGLAGRRGVDQHAARCSRASSSSTAFSAPTTPPHRMAASARRCDGGERAEAGDVAARARRIPTRCAQQRVQARDGARPRQRAVRQRAAGSRSWTRRRRRSRAVRQRGACCWRRRRRLRPTPTASRWRSCARWCSTRRTSSSDGCRDGPPRFSQAGRRGFCCSRACGVGDARRVRPRHRRAPTTATCSC